MFFKICYSTQSKKGEVCIGMYLTILPKVTFVSVCYLIFKPHAVSVEFNISEKSKSNFQTLKY